MDVSVTTSCGVLSGSVEWEKPRKVMVTCEGISLSLPLTTFPLTDPIPAVTSVASGGTPVSPGSSGVSAADGSSVSPGGTDSVGSADAISAAGRGAEKVNDRR